MREGDREREREREIEHVVFMQLQVAANSANRNNVQNGIVPFASDWDSIFTLSLLFVCQTVCVILNGY